MLLVLALRIRLSCWQSAMIYVFCKSFALTAAHFLIQVGWAGYLNATEKYFYCLDALPIFLAFCVYCLLPFGKYLDAPLALRLPTSVREVAVVDNTNSKAQRSVGKSDSAASKPMIVGQNSGRGRTEHVSATAIA